MNKQLVLSNINKQLVLSNKLPETITTFFSEKTFLTAIAAIDYTHDLLQFLITFDKTSVELAQERDLHETLQVFCKYTGLYSCFWTNVIQNFETVNALEVSVRFFG
jgi:hypothetical protein